MVVNWLGETAVRMRDLFATLSWCYGVSTCFFSVDTYNVRYTARHLFQRVA